MTSDADTDVVIPCRDLDRTLAFLTDELGFRLDMIMPADDPTVAVVSGHGTRLRLDARGPGGAPPDAAVAVDELVITRPSDDGAPGRAGMRYRDLVPDRRGGRLIASHITVPDGGPVPDYVHHHGIHFQVISCVAGWVRVVYEDQGPPFLLEAGDCVLQPPGIRHRVLETSPGAEVVEVTSPAVHETFVDHELTLPTADLRPDRRFDGQRFVRHVRSGATWVPWRAPGFEARDTGVGDATDGLAGVRTVRPAASAASSSVTSDRTDDGSCRPDPAGASPTAHDGELLFWYVVAGSLVLELADRPDETLTAGTAVVVPAGLQHRIASATPHLELLEVTVPDVLSGMARTPVP